MIHVVRDRFIVRFLAMAVMFTASCATGATALSAAEPERTWTIYIAQDKHLDYNWCGTTTEIELRMAALVDFYLGQAEQKRGRWNLDGTLWADVYHRHRGDEGLARLHRAIREGRFGCGGNQSVLLCGILDTETAIRAGYGSIPIERATGQSVNTALVMENPSMTWGVANVLSECGFDYVGRGIYSLRADSYIRDRDPYPLFWWKAPNGRRLLVHWDLYNSTRTWGGYAEAFRLVEMGGVRPRAQQLQRVDDRNTPEVLQKRKHYIQETVARYEAYGDAYPISSILLLGTGHDGWICSDDISRFIERFNAESDGRVRLVDARYRDFFEAASTEIEQKGLEIPILEGSFGICWEEWAALLDHAFEPLLRFAEHDMGGMNRRLAVISAGVRADAATQTIDIGRSLAPTLPNKGHVSPQSMRPQNLTGNDWQFGQAGRRDWTFRYRIVLSNGPSDPVAPLAAAQQFGTPPFLQAPGVDTCVPGLSSLRIDFPGGPVLACKTAEDGQRLVLRLWNVRNEACKGSLKLAPGFKRAERCDALERPQQGLRVRDGRVHFDAGSRAIVTIAFCRD